jgi:predicted transcriptional regulator
MAKNSIKWTPELEKELYTTEEIEENNLQAKLICELVKARREQAISQRDLETISGITQSAIARLEKGVTSPTLDTLFKVLIPLGKTLEIVPITAKHR